MVDFPTHINGNTLDLVISSPEVHISDLKILFSPLRSDHYMLGFTSPLLAKRRADSSFSRVSMNYKKADFDNMSSFLLDHDFSSYYQSSDIEFLWHYIKDTILSSISLYTPVIKKRSHPQPPWFTSSIQHQLHKVHSLRNKCKHNPSPWLTLLLIQRTPKSMITSEVSLRVVVFRLYCSTNPKHSLLPLARQMPSMISSILSSTLPVRMPHSLTYHFLQPRYVLSPSPWRTLLLFLLLWIHLRLWWRWYPSYCTSTVCSGSC